MIIGIDANEANVAQRVGSNQYAYEILRYLEKLDHKNQFTIYLKDKPQSDLPQERSGWHYRVFGPKPLWTQWRLPLDLIFTYPRPDVFFTLGHYAPRISPIPTVIAIMDLAFLHFPELFLKKDTTKLTNWTRYSAKHARHIITISANSKKDIANYYDIPVTKISVAYPGFDQPAARPPTTTSINRITKKYNLSEDYILYLGTLQPRKNLVRLLQAFEALPAEFKDIFLVIAGKRGWLYQKFVHQLNLSPKKDRVRLTGFIEEDDIPALYAGAKCFCLVGLYEGFGIPALEALVYGTVPVVANTASLPEVVGQGGITVDPYSIKSISQGLEKALKLSSKERRQLITAGRQHIRQFNWAKSAQKILEVVYEVAVS
jgi:glycosyltransferase involved in cell wall biosynthesis